MAARRPGESSPVDAVQAIFSALESLDAEARERVVASALSLLGMSTPARGSVQLGPTIGSERVAPDTRRPERALSPTELMQEKNPATNPQKITLFAYYRERYEGQGRFSRPELKRYFSKIKESPPGNYDRDFTTAVKQGWIHEDGAESYLTSRGLEAVEAGFGGRGLPRGRGAKKKARGKKSARKKRTSR